MTSPTKTLYTYRGSDPSSIDTNYWVDANSPTADGKKRYTFTGDTAPGDAKGASSIWAVDTSGGVASAPSSTTPSTTSSTPSTDTSSSSSTAPGATSSTPSATSSSSPSTPDTGQSPSTGTLPGDSIGSPSSSDKPTGTPDAGQAPLGSVAQATQADSNQAPVGGTNLQAASPSATDASTQVTEGSRPPGGGTQIDALGAAATQSANPPGPTASTTPPAVPDPPVIEFPHSDEVLDESLVAISGTADPAGSTVIVYADSQQISQASVDGNGDWATEVSLSNADYTLTAITSNAGSVSGRSDAVDITVAFDPQAPAVEPPSDPDEAFAEFIKARLMRNYPLSWAFISEVRAAAQLWLDAKGL